jgi:hypothetical protein
VTSRGNRGLLSVLSSSKCDKRWRHPQVLARSPALRGQASGLSEPLSRVIAEGLAKATLRGDGVLALAAAVWIAAADGEADDAFAERKASAAQLVCRPFAHACVCDSNDPHVRASGLSCLDPSTPFTARQPRGPLSPPATVLGR